LQQHFGKSADYFYWIARGIDERPVRANRIRAHDLGDKRLKELRRAISKARLSDPLSNAMAKAKPHYAQTELLLGDEQPFPPGFHYLPGHLDEAAQRALLADVRELLDKAALFQQTMPCTGAPLSLLMSNVGEYGWVTDREGGYRYQTTHPVTGEKWPAIPQRLLKLWADLTGETAPPNQSLINYYDDKAKLGLHQDRGDSSLNAPVVSISLGDDATFVVGGFTRKDPLRRLALHSGDIVWFGGPSRLIFHGVEGIHAGSTSILKDAGLFDTGRINVTLRRLDRSGHDTGDTVPGWCSA
jgi:alkylated DNA repair protein (DNA oxidative demethylase)